MSSYATIIRYIVLMLANKNNTWIKYATPISAVHAHTITTNVNI